MTFQRLLVRWSLVVVAAIVVGALSMAGPSSAGESGADAARGEELFQANCAMCHGSDATGMMGMHPALRGAVDRLTAEGVEVTIRNGRDTRPPMPAFGDRLGEDDIADLVAHLETLPAGPRNFEPEGGNGQRDGRGMGGMMRGGMAFVGVAVLLLVAALGGAVGYLIGRSRR